MLKASDCRKKAAIALQEAEAVRSPEARAALQRLAEQWSALANQIAREATRSVPSHPSDKHDKAGTADMADVLRARLYLNEGAQEDDYTAQS
jgi:hypothetical protein